MTKKIYKIEIETDNLKPITLNLNKGDMVVIDSEEYEKHKSSMLKLTVLFDEKIENKINK